MSLSARRSEPWKLSFYITESQWNPLRCDCHQLSGQQKSGRIRRNKVGLAALTLRRKIGCRRRASRAPFRGQGCPCELHRRHCRAPDHSRPAGCTHHVGAVQLSSSQSPQSWSRPVAPVSSPDSDIHLKDFVMTSSERRL